MSSSSTDKSKRSRAELRKSLLEKAYKRGMEEGGEKGAMAAQEEMKQRLTAIFLKASEMPPEHEEKLRQAREDEQNDVPRTLRAFNAVAELEGRSERLFPSTHPASQAAKQAKDVGNYMNEHDLDYRDEEMLLVDTGAVVIAEDGQVFYVPDGEQVRQLPEFSYR